MYWSWYFTILSALSLVALATPLVRGFALRYGFVDRPTARKLHRRPTPLLGGIALYLGILIPLLAVHDGSEALAMCGILSGATLLTFVGAWDDRRNLPVGAKMLAQLVAAMIIMFTGTRVDLPLPTELNVFLTLFWVVGITNAFNLLDNMDGLSTGVAALAAGFFLLLAILNGQPFEGLLASAVLGACLGFLIHNFHPARVFLGDAGSLLLGFLMAAIGLRLQFPDNSNLVTWMVPVLLLAVPIFDTSLVFFSRLRRGKNPLTTPGKDHVSHRLVRLGHSQRRAVLVIYLAGMLVGVAATAASVSTMVPAYALLAGMLLAGGLLIHWLERRAGVDTANSPGSEQACPPG